MINLDSYQAIKTSLFVRFDVAEYRTNSSDPYVSQILTFSDHDAIVTINGETYTPVGKLLGVTSSRSELRPSGSDVTITLSGIPDTSIAEIVHSKIKGSPVKIYRGYFNASTGAQINSFVGRFIGSINNYSLQEEFDVYERTASNTIVIECNSTVETLSNKVAGRRTNEQSMKSFYPTDTSMDRVSSLQGSNFDFGAPI